MQIWGTDFMSLFPYFFMEFFAHYFTFSGEFFAHYCDFPLLNAKKEQAPSFHPTAALF